MRFMMPVIGFVALTLTACGGAQAPLSNEAAAEQHEQAAEKNDQLARKQAAKYDPAAQQDKGRCTGGGAREGAEIEVCWSSIVNPTEDYLKKAQRYQKLAEAQRATSQKLREAEGGACLGVSELDRDMSPFAHPEDVEAVTPLQTAVPPVRPEGALITFRATAGMTGPRLERLITCQLSRNQCMDNNTPEMAYCPLVLKDVRATVTTTPEGLFAVAIRSDNPAIAQEVLKRSKALVIR
jgi:hypothetical protein